MYVKEKDNADWMWKEMCFYIPKKFQNNPPKPIDKDVTIKKIKERVVFAKKFWGYAMEDSVWIKHAEAFGISWNTPNIFYLDGLRRSYGLDDPGMLAVAAAVCSVTIRSPFFFSFFTFLSLRKQGKHNWALPKCNVTPNANLFLVDDNGQILDKEALIFRVTILSQCFVS